MDKTDLLALLIKVVPERLFKIGDLQASIHAKSRGVGKWPLGNVIDGLPPILINLNQVIILFDAKAGV